MAAFTTPLRRMGGGGVVLAATLLFASAAGAAPCSKQIVLDWAADGRVDRTYAIPCYQQAIDGLRDDLEVYSSIREDILDALAVAVARRDRGQTPSTGTTGTGTVTEPPPTGPAPLASDAGGSDSLPLPFVVLGGLALVLLAAGAAGMAWRRAQRGRRLP